MSKSTTAELADLDKRIKDLDSSLGELDKRWKEFQNKISTGVEKSSLGQLQKEEQDLIAKNTELQNKYTKTLQHVKDKSDSLARSRRNDNKILEQQNRLLQQRNALEGGILAKFGTLPSTPIDWGSVVSTANQKPSTPASLAESATTNAKASKDAAKASKQQRKEMEKMAVEASKIAKYMTAAFSIGAIKGFLSQMIQVTGEFEMQQVALRNIIKSENKSNEIWKKTLNLALNSPLTAMQLTKYTKQLAAFRIETNKIYDTTKMLADVSTGLGVDMERLILAYGHTKSSGFLRGMYARQFATAGVNIYGELAQYYSEMEGKEVTFKDVYERISKKLVAFADVEAVFKKLTSEGGTFYRMQEKLSDTVQGQVNKLKDAWQQLLNQMGSAKKGTMRDIVDILLKVITDFRIFVGLIRTGAVGLLAHQLANVAIALSGVSKKFMIASASATKFANGLKGLFTSMRGGLAQMGIAAIAMAITAIISANKEWQQQLEQIDNRTTDYRKQADAVKNLKEQIDENNKAIKGEEGATKDATAAKRDNKRILEQLKAEYPEQVSGIEAQTNGYIELSNALDDVIERLKRKQRYSRMEATTGGGWNDTLGENIGDLQREFNADERAVDKAVQAMENSITKTEETIENSNFSSEYKDFLRGRIDAYRQMIKIAEENEDDVEYVLDEWSKFSKMVNVGGVNLYLLGDIVYPAGIRGGTSAYERVVNSEQADRAKVIKDLQTYTQKTEQWLKKDLQNIDDYKDEIAQYESKGGVFGWLAKNAERVEKDIKEGKIPDVLGAFREHFRTDLGVTSKAMETYINKALNNLILHTQNSLAGRSYLFDFFVSPLSTEKENKPLEDEDKGTKQKKSINSLVELLKKMNTEYEKLKENAYGAAMSAQVVRDEYKEAFKEIFQTTAKGGHKLDDVLTMINWDTVDTTSKAGVAAGIQQLLDFMDANKLWGQYQRDARKQVEKMLSEMRVEMGIAVEVHKREDFDRKMEELFKDYELSVEMKELKIPEDVAESMFGFTYKTLGDLQAEMNKFYEEQQNNGLLDTKAWEAYKKYADKIDAEIMKERKERAKQYSKFMEREISDRAKLEKEYYDNIAMISSESAFTDKQKSNIIQQVTDDFQKALAKLDWETFKSSDFYVEMMDDLTNMPVKYMEVMLKEVNKVIENADILSPRALKEALRARREVREAILSEASLGGIFRETIGAFRAYRANGYTGDEANQEAERRLGMTPGATTVAGLIKERKLLREAVSIRSEYIAQKEEEIRLADEQIARLQSYWEAYNKFQSVQKSFENDKIEGPEGTSFENTPLGLAMARAATTSVIDEISQKQADFDKLSEDDRKKTLDAHEAEIRQLEQLKQRYEDLEHTIDNYITTKSALESAEGRLQNTDRDESGNVLQVSPLQEERNKLKLGKEDMEKAQLGDKEALKNLKRFTDAWNELSNNVNNAKEKLKSLGSATYDMLESLGMETNLVTDAWKNFADTLMDTITGALTMIPQLVAGFVSAGVSINAAMGIVGLIAEAIQLVITLITALAKLEDSYHLQAIEDSKKRVEELSKSFDKLNDVIEKTMSSAEYFTEYVAEVENLNQQLEEANLQLQEAAQIKDKSDREEATKNAEDAIDEINKELEEVANDLQDTFGGIARKDFRSWAEEFVDAWTDAFLETGDGYDALMETFEDKMLETFKKQALMRGLAKIMEPLERAINSAVSDSIIDDYELNRIRQMMEVAGQQGDEYLRRMAEIWDLGATGQLSGLSAGISGMTEETAEVLEGYWNSVRMYTAETNQNVAIIADAFSNPDSTNPMLGQLRLIAEQATQIRTLLDSVTKSAGHSRGGAGIKVFMS